MLTTQTSSGSGSNLLSPKNEFVSRRSEIPEKFKVNCVYSRKVFNNKDYVEIIITSNLELIECKAGEVVNYINLEDYFPPDDKVQKIKSEHVEVFPLIRSSDDVVFAVLIKSVLFGVERKESQLKVSKVMTNVKAIRCIYDESLNEPSVSVTFFDETELLTRFQEDDLEKFMRNNAPEFRSILQYVKNKSETARRHLADLNKEIDEIAMKMYEMPKILLQDDLNEIKPLVRYGSIWTRVVNDDKFVVGIPVFCMTKRRFIIENMKLVIDHPSASDLNFKSSLFKMQTDQLSFEKFEEMFDAEEEEEMPIEPQFNKEWKPCKKMFLHSHQPGVLVAVADVMQFVDSFSQKIKFFITYEIKSEESTTKMMLDAGGIVLDSKSFYSPDLEMFGMKSECYKDLLAVTSTSTMVVLTVNFEKPPKLKLKDFLKTSMKFLQLTDEDENLTAMDQSDFNEMDNSRMNKAKESFFFYCNDNYFKGVLVRLKTIDQLKISMKIYLRSNHQIVMFVKAIYEKYAERCTIDVKKSHEELFQPSNLISQKNDDDDVS